MYDAALVREIVNQTLTAIHRIERRAARVTTPRDLVSSDAGLDMLDAISMMLIAVGESCKNLDKVTGGTLLARYPEVDWKGAKGMRDVISHHYFDINAEVVFAVCRKQVPELRTAFEAMLAELS